MLMQTNSSHLHMLPQQLGLKLYLGLFMAPQRTEFILIPPTNMISKHSHLEEARKMVKMHHQLLVIHQIWEQLIYHKITIHTHHTQVLLINMVMAAWDTQATITTISSNLIITIHSL